MRTTLNIDTEALAAAQAVAPGKTKTEVINEALRTFARSQRRLGLLDLRGRISWEGNLDELRGRV